MNILKKLFSKKVKQQNTENKSSQEFEINSSLEEIEKVEQNRGNPDSSQIGKENYIELDADKFFNDFKGVMPREVFDDFQDQTLKGYNNFSIMKSVYNKLVSDKKILDNFNKNINETAKKNSLGIDFEKNGDVESAIKIYEEVISRKYPATHAFDRLMVLYRKKKDIVNEIRIIKIAIDVFTKENNHRAELAIKENNNKREKIKIAVQDNKQVLDDEGMICFNPYDVNKYKMRLEKITLSNQKRTINLPSEAQVFLIKGKALGDIFEETKYQFKEFDFYNSGEDRSNSFLENAESKKTIWKIQNQFKDLIADALKHEENGDLDKASVIYERIIAEKYYLTAPYDRLIKIYSKAKLHDEEKRVLINSISFFKDLKNKQKDYVIGLAKKYSKLSFAEERILNDKKISYFNGAFELYNPYNIIDKWEVRLKSLID